MVGEFATNFNVDLAAPTFRRKGTRVRSRRVMRGKRGRRGRRGSG